VRVSAAVKRLALASLTVLALAPAATARASTLVAKDFQADAPALAGNQVLFQTFGIERDSPFSIAPGRTQRRVITFPRRAGDGSNFYEVAASDRRLAFVRNR
jgi:hypothetical protein